MGLRRRRMYAVEVRGGLICHLFPSHYSPYITSRFVKCALPLQHCHGVNKMVPPSAVGFSTNCGMLLTAAGVCDFDGHSNASVICQYSEGPVTGHLGSQVFLGFPVSVSKC